MKRAGHASYTIGANEVKRGLNYSDKLLPFGYKRLITKQLREMFSYECIIGPAVTVSGFVMITPPPSPLTPIFFLKLLLFVKTRPPAEPVSTSSGFGVITTAPCRFFFVIRRLRRSRGYHWGSWRPAALQSQVFESPPSLPPSPLVQRSPGRR